MYVEKMRVTTLLVALLVAACGTTVDLRNPETGQTATCGPYKTAGIGGGPGAALLMDCIDDFERQGFVRIPN